MGRLTTGAPCVVLAGGSWEAAGGRFASPNAVTLAMDATACTFTLAEWAKKPEGPPGGAVTGDQVTLDGNALWKSCVGTAAQDGRSVAFTCDAGDFTLTWTG